MAPAIVLHANFYGYNSNEDDGPCGVLLPAAKPLAASKDRKEARPWTWSPLGPGGREDGLVLSHWAPKDSLGNPNPFAVFSNEKVNVLRYTDAEYSEVIAPRSSDWSKADTDSLLDLCERFDCRFLVVHDRFVPAAEGESNEGTQRTVDELKGRFYRVQRMLNAAAHGQDVDSALQGVCCDVKHETQRKKQLTLLMSRPAQDVLDEECLSVTAKRMSQRLKKLKDKAARGNSTRGTGEPIGSQHRLPAEERVRKKNKIASHHHDDPKQSTKPKNVHGTVSLRSAAHAMAAVTQPRDKDQLQALYHDMDIDLDVLCYTQRVCVALDDMERECLEYLSAQRAVEHLEAELRTMQARHSPHKTKTGRTGSQAIDVETTEDSEAAD